MKLALFGGSFDPPHQAHRALAEVALAPSARLTVRTN